MGMGSGSVCLVGTDGTTCILYWMVKRMSRVDKVYPVQRVRIDAEAFFLRGRGPAKWGKKAETKKRVPVKKPRNPLNFLVPPP